jgi:curved DNA-binding protein CbpA
MKEAPSHYEVLGIDRRANAAEIKAARGRRIAQWHPDKYLNRTSLERQNAEYQFKRVLEAYDVLGDPHLRERYDRECEKNSSRPNRPAASSPPLVSPGTVVLCEHSILTGTLWKVIVGERSAGELVASQNSAKSIGGRWELRGHVSTSDVRAASARANSLFSRWSHPDFVSGEGSLIVISTADDDIAFTSAVNDGWDWDKFENHVAYARPSRDVGELDRRIKSGFGPQHPTHQRVQKITVFGFSASFAFASLLSLLVVPMPSFGESEIAFEPSPPTAPEADAPPIPEDPTSLGEPVEPACGTSEALPRYRDLPGWSGYRCMRRELVPAVWASCLPRSAYSHTAGAGCPGRQLCCPADDAPVVEGDLAGGDNARPLPGDEGVGRSNEVEAAVPEGQRATTPSR